MTVAKPTALQRKAGADRPPPDHGAVSPSIALRLAISRSAQEILKIPMAGGEVEDCRATLSSMPELLPASGLWMLLNGPGSARGVASLDASLLAAVLQALTAGQVTGSSVAHRPPTPTDAFLARRFLALLLETLANRLETHPAHGWANGFHPREQIPTADRLPHLLVDLVYKCLSIEVDINHGLRTGRLQVFLPDDGSGETVSGSQTGRDRLARWQRALSERVMASEVCLETVLARIEVPLTEITRWQVGEHVVLPGTALEQVLVEDGDRRRVGLGTLGQVRGYRAVRLSETGSAAPQDMAGALRAPEDDAALGGAGFGTSSLAPPDALEIAEVTALDLPADPMSEDREGRLDMSFGDSLPDLPEIDGPDMDDMPAPGGTDGAGPGGDELPDLGELPELGDLPELDDLPPLD